jgi:hypothetical protein
MGIVRKIKQSLGLAPSLEEQIQRLSDTYPDTPDGTYRCERCGEVLPGRTVGNSGLKRDDDGEVVAVTFCSMCAENPR